MTGSLTISSRLRHWGISCTRTLGWMAHALAGPAGASKFESISSPGAHAFLGYYDVNLMRGNDLFLHCVARGQGRKALPNEASIVRHDRTTGQQRELCTTRAVNWQIGARAQLIDSARMILNDIDEQGHLCSKIVDLGSGREQRLALPLWYASREGALGVSIDFETLGHVRPGYGYAGLMPEMGSEALVAFALETGEVLLRLTRDEIADQLDLPRKGYLNHVIVNSSETRFLTTLNMESAGKRVVHPVVMDYPEGSIKTFHPGPTFSHPEFSGDDILLYFDGSGFVEYDLSRDIKRTLYKTRYDGHPTRISGDVFLSDTYPDRLSKMSVYVFDGAPRVLASVANPPWYKGDLRCDLHPRLNEGSVVFDYPSPSGRKVGVIEVEL